MPRFTTNPDRPTIAQAMIGPNAPTSSERIRSVFSELKITPPKDFVITPFDTLVLGELTQTLGLRDRISSDDLAQIVEQKFHKHEYKSINVSGDIIDEYFMVLRGDRPGCTLQEGAGQAMSWNFPEIRDRFNIMHTMKFIELGGRPDVMPNFKQNIQSVVAGYLLDEATHQDIRDDLQAGLSTHLVIDMMILDLVEILHEYTKPLKDNMLESIGIGLKTVNAKVGDLINAIEKKEFLTPVKHPIISRCINQGISRLWLALYEENPEKFHPLNLNYIRQATIKFITAGSGEVNAYFRRNNNYRNLGGANNQIGSWIVHTVFGLDMPKYSPVEFIDNYYDQLQYSNEPLSI